jgi:schlafen family protein
MAFREKIELQELVDHPNETLSAEYKEWFDPSDNAARAKLARHLAAMANHGGGVIVVGFTDAMAYAGANPFTRIPWNRDTVTSIVKKYLEPSFQCNVYEVTSSAGNVHPVIEVPPHKGVPICAKAGGPVVEGKSTGIERGVYYIRKPGPESAPILTAVEWAPIIRRCAMHERAAIIAAIDAAIRGGAARPDTDEALKIWHDAARSVFVKDAQAAQQTDLIQRNFQFSYTIEPTGDEKIDLNQVEESLRRVNSEVRDLVITGWSMFYVFTKQAIAPRFETDPAIGGGEQEFLESALLRDTSVLHGGADMWRVSPDGKATILREYWEDSGSITTGTGIPPGKAFSPNLLVQSLAEFVRHARALAERFESATTVSIRCEWRGLAGRVVHDPEARWVGVDSLKATSDSRTASGRWPVGAIQNNWAEIVAELAAPVARVFGLQQIITPGWILGQAGKWRR